MPIYEACEKCRMPVLSHTGEYRPHPFDAVAKRPVLRNMAPITMDRIARSFPALHIVMAAIFVMIRRNVLLDLRKIRENQQPCNGIPHHGFLFLCAVTSIGLSGIGDFTSRFLLSAAYQQCGSGVQNR